MKNNCISLFLCLFLFACATKTEQKQDKENRSLAARPNILLLCVDDLRPELNSFGASYIKSPNIDALAKQGVAYQRHYVNAPSCGPSRYTMLTGTYGPAGNSALFQRSKKYNANATSVNPTMPEWFRSNGYTTVSVGKVSHHPGGRGGADWNDSTEIEMPNAWDRHLMPTGKWQHPRGAMHGLANGEIRTVPSEMSVFQHTEGDNTIYPDGLIAKKGMEQLSELAADKNKPFFLAIGLIKPHLPFGAPKKYYDMYDGVELPDIQFPDKPKGQSTWHRSGEFRRYNLMGHDPITDAEFATEVRRHYAACVSYADDHIGQILETLKQTGADKNTIIVLWGDHGWHLGEHAIWGKHSLFEEALRSPLIISYPGQKNKGAVLNDIVETSQIFPTLCDLAGVEVPNFLVNGSVFSQNKSNTAVAYKETVRTIRNDRYRMTLHNNNFAELYDHTSPEKETKNVAEQNPEVVAELTRLLNDRLKK